MTLPSSHLKTTKTSKFPPLFRLRIFKLWYDKEDVIFSDTWKTQLSARDALLSPSMLGFFWYQLIGKICTFKEVSFVSLQSLNFSWNHRWISVSSIEVNIGHQTVVRAPLDAQSSILSKRLEDDSMTLSSSHLKTAKTSKFPLLFRVRTRYLVSLLTPWIFTCCIFQAYH